MKSNVARAFRLLLIAFVWMPLGAATPAERPLIKLVVVHTNDIHDHVRAREDGRGGLPYLAGFVAQLRQQRDNVLVVDAGDLTEKGDLISARTEGLTTYEAMRLVGYHAVTIGNHDLDRVPLERLRRHEEALGQKLLCANLLGANGKPLFEPSRLVRIGDVQVGLVGLTLAARDGRTRDGLLDLPQSGRLLAREAQKLRKAGADIVVAVCHEGTKACAELAKFAPDVALFVSAHTHEVVTTPIVVPGTRTLIVQAGSYARWAGMVELDIERGTGRVVRYGGTLVEMTAAISPDQSVMELVAAAERKTAPEAGVFVIHNPATITPPGVGRLGAEALRSQTGADIGFCLPSQVVRDDLPAGELDFNSLYRAVGLIGAHIVEAELTGAEIAAHFTALQRTAKEAPEWSGFVARRANQGELLQAELEPTRTYRVVMPRREWVLVQRHVSAARVQTSLPELKERGHRADISLAAALRDYLTEQRERGKSMKEILTDVAAARSEAKAEALAL